MFNIKHIEKEISSVAKITPEDVVFLTGSYAQGIHDFSSDIDLVIMSSSVSEIQKRGCKSSATGHMYDVNIYPAQSYREVLLMDYFNSGLLISQLESAIPIQDRKGGGKMVLNLSKYLYSIGPVFDETSSFKNLEYMLKVKCNHLRNPKRGNSLGIGVDIINILISYLATKNRSFGGSIEHRLNDIHGEDLSFCKSLFRAQSRLIDKKDYKPILTVVDDFITAYKPKEEKNVILYLTQRSLPLSVSCVISILGLLSEFKKEKIKIGCSFLVKSFQTQYVSLGVEVESADYLAIEKICRKLNFFVVKNKKIYTNNLYGGCYNDFVQKLGTSFLLGMLDQKNIIKSTSQLYLYIFNFILYITYQIRKEEFDVMKFFGFLQKEWNIPKINDLDKFLCSYFSRDEICQLSMQYKNFGSRLLDDTEGYLENYLKDSSSPIQYFFPNTTIFLKKLDLSFSSILDTFEKPDQIRRFIIYFFEKIKCHL